MGDAAAARALAARLRGLPAEAARDALDALGRMASGPDHASAVAEQSADFERRCAACAQRAVSAWRHCTSRRGHHSRGLHRYTTHARRSIFERFTSEEGDKSMESLPWVVYKVQVHGEPLLKRSDVVMALLGVLHLLVRRRNGGVTSV